MVREDVSEQEQGDGGAKCNSISTSPRRSRVISVSMNQPLKGLQGYSRPPIRNVKDVTVGTTHQRSPRASKAGYFGWVITISRGESRIDSYVSR